MEQTELTQTRYPRLTLCSIEARNMWLSNSATLLTRRTYLPLPLCLHLRLSFSYSTNEEHAVQSVCFIKTTNCSLGMGCWKSTPISCIPCAGQMTTNCFTGHVSGAGRNRDESSQLDDGCWSSRTIEYTPTLRYFVALLCCKSPWLSWLAGIRTRPLG